MSCLMTTNHQYDKSRGTSASTIRSGNEMRMNASGRLNMKIDLAALNMEKSFVQSRVESGRVISQH